MPREITIRNININHHKVRKNLDMMAGEIWLQENLINCPKMVELSRRLGYSESHLRRSFREVFGIGPGQYRDHRRLQRAALLLLRSDLQIIEISEQCGYKSHSVFTRAFNAHFGCPPRTYRDLSRQYVIKRELASLSSEIAWVSCPKIKLNVNQAFYVNRIYGLPSPMDVTSHWHEAMRQWDIRSTPSHWQASWIYYDDRSITPSDQVRIDVGMHMPENEVPMDGMFFYRREIRYQRTISLCIDQLELLRPAYLYLVHCWMPTHNETMSGDPITVVCHAAKPAATGNQVMEMTIPLLNKY